MTLPYNFWSSLALLLLLALSLSIPSGYSYGPLLLVIVAIGTWYKQKDKRSVLPQEAIVLYISFALLATSWLIDDLISGGGSSALDKPLKILLTLTGFWYVTQRPPTPSALWYGAGIGAIGASAVGTYQILAGDPLWVSINRVGGFTNAIQFGDIALLLGMIALCGWDAHREKPLWKWRAALIIAFICGLSASIMSGTRGGWLALATLASLFIILQIKKANLKTVFIAGTVSVLTLGAAWHTPQLRIQERIATAISEAKDYQSQRIASTSIGARLQMWDFAWTLYAEKPVLGWSQRGYQEQKIKAIAEGHLDPTQVEYNHPHNELLDAAAKRGTIGLIVTLLCYLVPLAIFANYVRESKDNSQINAIATAGMLIPLSYLCFGVTQSFLPHNSGTMMYFYLTMFIWGIVWNLKWKGVDAPSKPRLSMQSAFQSHQ